MMTIDEVKRDLPPVRIEYNGRKYWGRVSGRLNKWASVSPSQLIDNRERITTVLGPVFHYSWETVTNAINNGGTLRV
jgi:hypothetical protein